jgi:GNAT superfamily N-acetyltransferase
MSQTSAALPMQISEPKDSDLRYRELLASDIPAIARVHRRACLVAYAFMNWSYSEWECRRWYEGKFPEWDWGLIAEDSAPIAFIAVTGTHLDQLFVAPVHQRRGVGTCLLRAALERAPSIATLNVFEKNASARTFYEKNGFREVRRFLNARERAVELVYRRLPK